MSNYSIPQNCVVFPFTCELTRSVTFGVNNLVLKKNHTISRNICMSYSILVLSNHISFITNASIAQSAQSEGSVSQQAWFIPHAKATQIFALQTISCATF